MAESSIYAKPLPVGSAGRNSTAWLGALCLIATEGSLFVYLLFSYAYAATQHGPGWLPTARPAFTYALPGTAILLLSSVAVWWGERGIKGGHRRQHLWGLGLAVALGILFLVVQAFEWRSKTFSLASSGYGSFFFTITGFHMAHVVIGVAALAAVLGWSIAGRFSPRRHAHVMIASAYWHFVDAVWLAVFFAFYVAPYFGGAG